jgi:uncharacterized protein YjbI with pentapeptide repeats
MHTIPNGPRRVPQIAAALLVSLSPLLLISPSTACADIYQWKYINPADPSEGKQQSTMLAPDGAGVDAVPGAILSLRNLTRAYLVDADLTGAIAYYSNLTDADLSQANLTNVDFFELTLTGAKLNRANLTNANFSNTSLADADFTNSTVRGASFAGNWFFTAAQLYSTASYKAHELTRINLGGSDLSGWNFAGQNLADAYFGINYPACSPFDVCHGGTRASLTGANFVNANVRGASFNGAYLTDANFAGAKIHAARFDRTEICIFGAMGGCGIEGGIALSQLYSTASYEVKDLSGIHFTFNDLTGGNFVGQNLTNVNFYGATLTGTDLTAADTRGAYLNPIAADDISTNLILPDGQIHGLDLDTGGLLVVRDDDVGSLYDPDALPIPITIDQHLAMGPGGTLRLVFEADAWDSTISFAPGIPVTLGGTLELTFAEDVNLASQIGRTFDLFDWMGVSPTGAFIVTSPYSWNLSNLYTTGEVTLTAVPEPRALIMLCVVLAALVVMDSLRFSLNSRNGVNQ